MPSFILSNVLYSILVFDLFKIAGICSWVGLDVYYLFSGAQSAHLLVDLDLVRFKLLVVYYILDARQGQRPHTDHARVLQASNELVNHLLVGNLRRDSLVILLLEGERVFTHIIVIIELHI